MAKECKVQCKNWISDKVHPKDCKHWVKYSDRSYRKMLKYGHSNPEYCPLCQKVQAQARAEMAVSYFSLKLKPKVDISALKMGPLGMIQHPERPRIMEDIKSTVDTEFGVTEEDVQQVYKWFKDPKHRVVIVIGGTGSGKSTKFVSWLATPPSGIPEDFFTRFGQIIVGQPRRVASSGAGKFASEIDGGTHGIGGIGGHTFAGETMADWRNLWVQKTHHQVLNLIENGDLKNVGLVMIDEAHERSLEIDSLMRNLKEQLPVHPHLRVVIASATIDSEKFRHYFGDDITTIVEFKAERKHKYENPKTGEVNYAEEDNMLPYDDLVKLAKKVPSVAADLTFRVLEQIQKKELSKGDILVFMPGKREVESTVEQLVAKTKKAAKVDQTRQKVLVLPLYRGLDNADKTINGDEKPDTIRVIVSTNIAEASVTIKSLVYVIETGLAKVPVWNDILGQTKIPLTLISQANARQRWGRAGRVRDGRVFTLYTKDQFENLMPEYPIPDIQRLNLENEVMNSRAAGLTDLKEGWLENPPSKEIDRAIKVLSGVKALDSDNSLTDYGRLLRRFNYPAKIVDMLLSADLKGCLVEVATLIPMIRNGGLRQVLLWDKRWSAQTKYEVFKIHKGLMAGCRDDIEFLLKVYLSWEADPTNLDPKTKKFKRRISAERQAWAKRNFVNHEILAKVSKEREEEILSSFYVHKKDPNFRFVEIDLITRVKDILKKYLANDIVSPQKDTFNRYQYFSRIAPIDYSLTTFSSLDPAKEPNLFERLLSDQLLPVNCVYECKVINIIGEYAEVEIEHATGDAIPVMEMLSDVAEEKEDEDTEETEEEAEEKKKIAAELADAKVVEKLSRQVYVGKFTFPVLMKLDNPQTYKVGQKVQVVADEYGYYSDMNAYALVRPIPDAESYKNFGSRYMIGDQVELNVIEIGEYPEDPEVSLITQEPTSGVIIALDPEDVVFAYAKSALRLIPVGTKLTATVVDIDNEHRFIKTSTLPEVERQMNNLFAKNAEGSGKCTVEATVLEIDAEHAVHLILNWSQPEKGLLFVVSKQIGKWHKPLEETGFDEKYQVTFSFYSDWDNGFNFGDLPKEVQKILDQRIASNLTHEDGKLSFQGRMTFGVLQELLKVTKNSEFRRAIRKLYWKSNQPHVGAVIGDITTLPMQFTGTVSSILDFGVFVRTPVGADGLIHESKLRPKRPSDFLVGTNLEVKVIRLDPVKKKIELDLVQK